MKTNASIIAAIDFSAASPLVLRHAMRAAKLHGSPVHAVHVLDSCSQSAKSVVNSHSTS